MLRRSNPSNMLHSPPASCIPAGADHVESWCGNKTFRLNRLDSCNERAPAPQCLSDRDSAHILVQSEVASAAADLFSGEYSDFKRLLPVYANAEIDTRCSCVPLDWYLQPHSFSERNDLYLKHALDLIEDAARVCLEQAGMDPSEIGGLVVVSSTGVATPSLDALLMERMQLRRDIRRLPVFGLGCVGWCPGPCPGSGDGACGTWHAGAFPGG